MTENKGQWFWETDDSPAPVDEPKKEEPQSEIALYTFPKRKARRGEDADHNGMRPMSARERAAQLKNEDEDEYFKWGRS